MIATLLVFAVVFAAVLLYARHANRRAFVAHVIELDRSTARHPSTPAGERLAA